MLFESIKNLPPELATLLMAMLPVTELRLAIPFAVGVLKLPIWPAFVFSVVGNIIPAVIIVWFLKPLADWLSAKSKFFHRFFTWWFERTIKNFSAKYEKYGLWALMIFVSDEEKSTILSSNEWKSWTSGDGSGTKRWNEIQEFRQEPTARHYPARLYKQISKRGL